MSVLIPQQFPAKFYSWQDQNAPQLSNTDGCLKTILKACLVTGYGEKAGAGWTSVFEDDYRLVLQRPFGVGNPPTIKIENGVVNGAASHRLVFQDNPTSLDDVNEVFAVNLLAKDPLCGKEWYLIATDFAFVLCYQMGPSNYKGDKGAVLFVGSIAKFFEAQAENFLVSGLSSIFNAGQITNNGYGFFSNSFYLFGVRSGVNYNNAKKFLTLALSETAIGGYYAQPIFIENLGKLPFFTSVSASQDDEENKQVTIATRPMLRFATKASQSRVLYIPLDYWEL